MKLRRSLLLAPLLLLLFTVAASAQSWSSFSFNATTWNGTATITRALNQTNLTGSGTSITGFRAVDPLSIGLTVSSGSLDLIISATYEVRVNQSDTVPVVTLAVDPNGDSSGQITNQGDGVTAGWALFFNMPGSSLTAGRAYFYKITVLDTGGHVSIYSGTIRVL